MRQALILLTLTLLTPPAQAQEDILAKVSLMETQAKDAKADITMTLIDAKGQKSTRKASTWQKDAKRMFKFTYPPDVKGVAFLVQNDDNMFLYMPAFRKVRRIAGHVRNDNFMGTDLSYDDMGSMRYQDHYDVSSQAKEADLIRLDLKPKASTDKPYGKVILWVRSQDHMAQKADYYDKDSVLWKQMRRDQFTTSGKYTYPKVTEMKDVKKDHTTRLEILDHQTDTGIEDSWFSERYLKQ